jgi:hypothetical protein
MDLKPAKDNSSPDLFSNGFQVGFHDPTGGRAIWNSQNTYKLLPHDPLLGVRDWGTFILQVEDKHICHDGPPV